MCISFFFAPIFGVESSRSERSHGHSAAHRYQPILSDWWLAGGLKKCWSDVTKLDSLICHWRGPFLLLCPLVFKVFLRLKKIQTKILIRASFGGIFLYFSYPTRCNSTTKAEGGAGREVAPLQYIWRDPSSWMLSAEWKPSCCLERPDLFVSFFLKVL